MADRFYKNQANTLESLVSKIFLNLTFPSTPGNPTLNTISASSWGGGTTSLCKGVTGVTRNSAGNYTIQFGTSVNGLNQKDVYNKLLAVDATWESASATLPPAVTGFYIPNGGVQVRASGALTINFTGPGTGSASDYTTYGILGNTTITNTGTTQVNGNLGLYPGTSVTGSPTVSGQTNVANPTALAAQSAASAAYTALAALTSSTIPTALDGYTYTPGTYSSAGGTFTLAQSGAGTLTLNGAGQYVFQTTSTLTTGAGGTPTMTLENGATANEVFFVVGSSATINSGHTGVFNGNILAHTSITDTSGGTVNGSLVALNGAVTLSAGTTINAQPAATGVDPNGGDILRLEVTLSNSTAG